CMVCDPPVTLETNAQRVLEHMGAHILLDPGIDRTTDPCGLCLMSSQICRYFVTKGKGSKGSLHVEAKRSSGCTRKINFQYRSAETSTDTAPCSNVPIPCPLCPNDPAVWRYNLHNHFIKSHSGA
ncbi:hypothetical protein DFP72DRAFT_792072, partial [Ephemerocybe angulata]